MPDYEFDVFVSYEDDTMATQWIVDHFLPLFRTYLRNEIVDICQRPANKIFFSKTDHYPSLAGFKLEMAGLPVGQDWKAELYRAIRVSRCMVGLWNPPYFFSDYCRIEWHSFAKRAQSTGKRVVFGASVYDGKSFPAQAQSLQMVDLSQYASRYGKGLTDSNLYGDFQGRLQLLARNVAQAVRDAPAFSDWPIIDDQPPLATPTSVPLTRL